MTGPSHPPGGPGNPGGPVNPPRTETGRPKVTALDPDSEAGRAAAASLSQALAEISVAVARREAVARAGERAA